ncbi:MAG: hypothetical protein EOP45_11755, partial [Sphingobacteriaceae bacterium]
MGLYQAINESKLSNAVLKKIELSNEEFAFPLGELERLQTERKETVKRIEKDIFQSKKKLFELAESGYITIADEIKEDANIKSAI